MNFLLLFILGGSFLLASALPAQETSPATTEAEAPPPSLLPSATPLPSVTPPPALIPEDVLPKTTPTPPSAAGASAIDAQLAGSFQNPADSAAEAYRQRVEWRRLRNAVVNQPDVKAAAREAERARTDLRKRQLLRRYYELLFAKMTALAEKPDIKAYLNARKTEQLAALNQPRVRPQASPTPTPRPAPKASGAPPLPEPDLPAVDASPSPSP